MGLGIQGRKIMTLRRPLPGAMQYQLPLLPQLSPQASKASLKAVWAVVFPLRFFPQGYVKTNDQIFIMLGRKL